MTLKRLEPEKVEVKVVLEACDDDQVVVIEVTREQYEILQSLQELTRDAHNELNCKPRLEVKV